MANYYGTARSNYFAVKDEAAFRAEFDKLDVRIVTQQKDGEPLRFGLLDDHGDGGGWPSYSYDMETDEETEFEIPELVAAHLADGEVAVFVEAGAEKYRYVVGHATAINAAGERRDLNLTAIYALAAQLGPNVTPAEF